MFGADAMPRPDRSNATRLLSTVDGWKHHPCNRSWESHCLGSAPEQPRKMAFRLELMSERVSSALMFLDLSLYAPKSEEHLNV